MSSVLEQAHGLFEKLLSQDKADHFNTLGLRFIDFAEGKVTMELPFSEHIVGNPQTGVIHGGPITALLDSCCGFTAASALSQLSFCPTMDLRVDYVGQAKPHLSVYAEAEAYRITKNVVFCRAVAYQDDRQQPVAHCVANFARLDPEVSKKMGEKMEEIFAAGSEEKKS